MRALLLLVAATSLAACAQTPPELLRLSQEAYKDPSGYEIRGRGSVQPAGSSWQINFNVTLATAPAPLDNPQAPVNPTTRVGGRPEYVKVGSGNDEKPSSYSVPVAVVGAYTRMAELVASVSEIGTEQLQLNGGPVDCRVLEVKYEAPPEGPQPAPVRYSICSDKHLALKKVMFYPTGRHSTDPDAKWTITFDSAQFHPPAPLWLLDQSDQPTLTTRNEWLGKPAPAFKLADLDGNSVELSSMRGKVVLLDFWSTSCAPCVREMPTIQKVAGDHKEDVVLWGVSLDVPDRDKKWLALHQQSFPTLSDNDYAVSDLYKVHGIPAVVLISREGRILNYWQGEVPQTDLEAALKKASQIH